MSISRRTRYILPVIVIGHIIIYATIRKSGEETSTHCSDMFNNTLEDNIKVIQNYPPGDAQKYLMADHKKISSHQNQRDKSVFVTAFDRTHYLESQGLFKSLHEIVSNTTYKKDLLIIVYDLGLTAAQAEKVQINCKCEFRFFPFEQYPAHVKTLRTYAFKPIIIQLLLREYGIVWWVDTSVRFMKDNTEKVIKQATVFSYLFKVPNSYYRPNSNRSKGNLTKHTMKATFDFLQESSNKFKPFYMLEAGHMIFHADHISYVVVKAWANCALNKDCIAPPGSHAKLRCNPASDIDGDCHRFDQSVISIITRRLFQDRRDNLYQADYYQIKLGNHVQYFK